MIPPGESAGEENGGNPGYRFPKKARLALSYEFARVKDRGRAVQGRYMIMGVYRSGGAEESRIGLITSRRVGNAVLRNRVRRRLREIVRMEWHRTRAGLWIVLVARPPAAEANSTRLRDEYIALGNRAAIFLAAPAA